MTLYLDTSSLLKLYVEEDESPEVRAIVDRAQAVVTSVVTFAETRATLSRLRREKRLTPTRYAEAKRAFMEDWPKFLTVSVTDDLARSAGDLAEKHGLRGFDSIHLATFAQVLERSEDDVEFSSFDKRMVAAARRQG
jgi:predicted nucleic acid-binding protein